MKYNKFAQTYFKTNPNIYFFLKDCGFKRIFIKNGKSFPDNEIQILFNKFKIEMDDFHWTRNKVSINYYSSFLEDLFKKTDFRIDLELVYFTKH